MHVDDLELAEFVVGGGTAVARERIASHLDACETCREVVAAAVRAERGERVAQPIGTELGRYRLGRRLGAGQMGEIYAAFDPALGREIALKLVQPRGDDRARAAERLLVEARAMAQLRHPAVVRIYDVGSAGDQVFIAMEQVGSGVTLRQWLADAPRRPAEVLAMFRTIGEGLHAAHAAGVIHGDVKPDNVLIDGDGRPLVADFGLARASGVIAPAERTSSVAIAATAPAIGTPATSVGGTPVYMAPELFAGGLPTARSDQYSFCVALEEALTGQRPFDGDTLTTLIDAVSRGARRPRKAVGGVPRRVWAAIDRGLAVDPAQRFPALPALLAELVPRRTRVYAVAGGAGLVVAAAAVIALAPRGESPCTGAAAELGAVWSPVRRSAIGDPELAARIDQRAASWRLARIATCAATHERGVQSAALLDARMGCLTEQLAQLAAAIDSAAAASSPPAVARARAALRGVPDPTACGEIAAARSQLAPIPPSSAAAVAAIRADLARAGAAEAAGDLARGKALATSALDRARTTGYPPVLAEALFGAAVAQPDGPPAEAAFREAAQVAAQAHDDRVEVAAWTRLVYLAGYVGSRHGEADAWAAAAHAALARAGSPPALAAELAGNEAALALSRGDAKTALARADEELAFDRAARASPSTLANAQTTRAAALKRFGKLADARAAYQTALDLLAPDRADNAVLYAITESDGAAILTDLGKLPAAEAALTDALATERRLLGDDDVSTTETIDHLGALAYRRGRLADAERWWREAYDHRIHTNRRLAADSLANVAAALWAQHKLPAARAAFTDALAIRSEVLGANHPDVAETRLNLALLDFSEGHAAEAAAGFERARDDLRAAYGDNTIGVATAWADLGDARDALHDPKSAAAAYHEAIIRFEQLPGHDAELAYSLVGYSQVARTFDPKAAIAAAERAVTLRTPIGGSKLGDAYVVLAEARLAAGDRPNATAAGRTAEQLVRAAGDTKRADALAKHWR